MWTYMITGDMLQFQDLSYQMYYHQWQVVHSALLAHHSMILYRPIGKKCCHWSRKWRNPRHGNEQSSFCTLSRTESVCKPYNKTIFYDHKQPVEGWNFQWEMHLCPQGFSNYPTNSQPDVSPRFDLVHHGSRLTNRSTAGC